MNCLVDIAHAAAPNPPENSKLAQLLGHKGIILWGQRLFEFPLHFDNALKPLVKVWISSRPKPNIELRFFPFKGKDELSHDPISWP